MTLGHVYDLDLKKNENLIKEVIVQAQGEVKKLNPAWNIRLLNARWRSKNLSNKLRRPGRVTV